MSDHWEPSSLRVFRKVLLYFALAAVLVALAQGFFERRSLVRNVEAEIPRVAGYFLPVLGNALWNLDTDQAQSIARGIAQSRFVSKVIVKEARDNFAFAVQVDPDKINMQVVKLAAEPIEGRSLTFDIPAPGGTNYVTGSLVVVIDEAAIDAQTMRGLMLIFVNTGILSLILVAALMVFGTTYLGRPIRALTTGVRGMDLATLGQSRLAVDTAGNAELDILQTSFNELADRLSGAIASEKKARQESREALSSAELMFVDKEMAERSSDMLGKILDNSPVSTFVIGPDHCVTHWNRACEKLLRRSKAEIIGTREVWRGVHGVAQPTLADCVMDADAVCLAEHMGGVFGPSSTIEGGYEGETYFPLLGLWLYVTAAPIHDAEGRVVGAIETVQDVSERKLAEQSLSAELAFSKALLNAQSDCGIGMAILDFERIVFANDALARIWGGSVEQLQELPSFIELYHPDERATILAKHRRRVSGEQFSNRYDTRILRADGVMRDVELAVATQAKPGRRQVLVIMVDITDRKQADAKIRQAVEQQQLSDKALTQSEEKYRQVIENVSEGISLVQNRRFVFANPKTLEITGYSAEELYSKEFVDVIYPEDRAKVGEFYTRRLAGELIDERYDFRVLRRDGSFHWVEMGAVVIQWEGAPATLCFTADISQRKALEESLRCTLVEREIVLEHSIVGIVFLAADGRVRWANRGLADMLGLTGEVALGSSLRPYYADLDDYVRVGEEGTSALARGENYATEVRLLRPDGKVVWVSLSGKAVQQNDMTHGSVWAVVDISVRKELEDELHKVFFEREAMLQSALVGIAFVLERKYIWVNRTFAKLTGVLEAQLMGQTTQGQFADEAAWREFGQRAYPAIARGESFSTESQMRQADGSLLWVEASGCAVDPSEPGKGTIWTFLDISRRKQAELDIGLALEQQKELNVLKSRFVSMTSHEFRTPLTTILSSTELLRHYAEKLSEADKLELYGSVEGCVEHMTHMLDNILLIGAADANLLGFAPAPLALKIFCSELLIEAEGAVKPGRVRPEVQVRFDVIPEEILLDRKLLRHILVNLLSNAFKYSPDGGVVRFEVTISPGEISFLVADQGIGIPEEDLARLFESFHRAANVGDIPGTGLGMPIVKKSAEAHGGRVSVESEVGRGTSFIVTLPVAGLGQKT
jgi:PAS domain S-box-containing protein